MKEDVINVTVVNGIIKLDCDGISLPNHLVAEKLVAELARLAGGKTTVKKKPNSHSHGVHGKHSHH